jgi:hypothetical protein
MQFFSGFLLDVDLWGLLTLQHILNFIKGIDGWICLVVSFVVFASFILSERLAKFNHPERQSLSRSIRSFASTWEIFGKCSIVFFVCTTVFLFLFIGLVATMNASIHQIDAGDHFIQLFEACWQEIELNASLFLDGLILAMVVSGLLDFLVITQAERGEGLRDVRMMHKLFKRMKGFSPAKFVDLGKGIFIGLEDGRKRKPVYIPFKQLSQTHMQVLGASGSGKGISLALIGAQLIQVGESVIVFDPKGDGRLPVVLSDAAEQAHVPFIHLDLQPDSVAQFNLLSGASTSEIEELLIAGLGLSPSDGDGNYYRGIDQDAAEQLSKLDNGGKDWTLRSLYAAAQADKNFEKADNFLRRLRQVSDLPAIATSHDLDLAGKVEAGVVIYIRGSVDNHRVKTLQTMLLIRILQVIKKRPTGSRDVALILDEFKHLLTSVSLDALGVVREMGCHAILAHQSLGDLGACPGLTRTDVEPVVGDNTTIKLVFRINDETASKSFAAKSGLQRTHVESVRELDEDSNVKRSWAEAQQTRMSEDMFTHLHRPSEGATPVAAGVLFGVGLAKLIAIAPLETFGELIPPVAAEVEECVSLGNGEELI